MPSTTRPPNFGAWGAALSWTRPGAAGRSRAVAGSGGDGSGAARDCSFCERLEVLETVAKEGRMKFSGVLEEADDHPTVPRLLLCIVHFGSAKLIPPLWVALATRHMPRTV